MRGPVRGTVVAAEGGVNGIFVYDIEIRCSRLMVDGRGRTWSYSVSRR